MNKANLYGLTTGNQFMPTPRGRWALGCGEGEVCSITESYSVRLVDDELARLSLM